MPGHTDTPKHYVVDLMVLTYSNKCSGNSSVHQASKKIPAVTTPSLSDRAGVVGAPFVPGHTDTPKHYAVDPMVLTYSNKCSGNSSVHLACRKNIPAVIRSLCTKCSGNLTHTLPRQLDSCKYIAHIACKFKPHPHYFLGGVTNKSYKRRECSTRHLKLRP